MFWICTLGALLAGAGAAHAALVLNEILYDPPGPDTGAEFVEIFHDGDQPQPLTGCRLVFLNGSDPTRPVVAWTASAADQVEAGSFFVIGGEGVEPRDATARLSLQNGPDALQLWRGDTLLDAVAWGELDLGEGPPAADVSGTSLGRIPDGADTDDNAADWFELDAPNPGARNLAPSRFSLHLAEVEPPWRTDPGSISVRVHAVAQGADAWQQDVLGWWLDGQAFREDPLAAGRGDTLAAATVLALGFGPHELSLQTGALPETLRVRLHVGLADVVLNEILARPAPGAPEWIELRSLGGIDTDLRGWAIADATRDPHALPDGAHLAAGGYAVVSQDCLALEQNSTAPCWELLGGWATLNNTASGGGWADEVFLHDPAGAVVDWAPYDERLQPETGVSMERSVLDGTTAAVWFVSPGDPTPGEPNLTAGAAVPGRGLEISPNPFSPDGDGREDVLHVVLRLDAVDAVASAEIFDLAGEPIRKLGEHEGAGLLQWIWDGQDGRGRPVAMGAYVVVVRSSARAAPWRALVALGRRS